MADQVTNQDGFEEDAVNDGFVADEPVEGVDDGFLPDPGPVKPEPDMTAMKELVTANLAKKPKKEASSILEDIEAGWDMSVTGLAIGGEPDVVLPENGSILAHTISGIAQMAGDAPAIAAGIIGAAPAGPIASGAAAFALPSTIRKIMMDHYERGDIQSADEFVGRTMGTIWEATKSATVGAATAGVGQALKPALPAIEQVAGKIASRLVTPAAELVTMTSVGAGMEGQLPNARDFTVGGLTIAAIHAMTKLPGAASKITGSASVTTEKARQVYAETGIKPEQIAQDAIDNPVIHQEMLIKNGEIPENYKAIAKAETELEAAKAVETPVAEKAPVVEEAAPKEYSPATLEILSKIGEKPEAAKKSLSDKLANEKMLLLDRLDPLYRFVKKVEEVPGEIPVSENPALLAKTFSDHKALTQHIFEKGTIDFKTRAINGKGIKEIIDPIEKKGDLELFDGLLAAKRDLDYEKRGLNSGFDRNAAKAYIREHGAMSKAAEEFTGVLHRVNDYLADSGVISKKAGIAMKQSGENFVPLKRIFEEDSGKKSGKGGALKRVKGVEEGADLKTQSPMISAIDNIEFLTKLAEKNRVNNAFVELASKFGDEFIERVDGKKAKIDITESELAAKLKKLGFGDVEVERMSVFRELNREAGPGEVKRAVDGKVEIWRIKDENIATALKSIDYAPEQANIFLKTMQGITNIKRVGITFTPGFIVRNAILDQITSGATSKEVAVPFADFAVALGDAFKKNDNYYNWLRSGGVQGSFLEMSDSYIKRNIYKLNKETGFIDAMWNNFDRVKEAISTPGKLVENASRIAEFKRVSKGATSGEKLFEGGVASRDITADFETRGSDRSVAILNSITAFQNASIRFTIKEANFMKDMVSFDKGAQAKWAKVSAYLIAPTIALWWATKDDPRLDDVPQWQKDVSWVIPTNHWVDAKPEDHQEMVPAYNKRVVDGKVQLNKGIMLRIPKPGLLGTVFGTGTERILNAFYKHDPGAFEGFAGNIAQNIIPPYVPDVMAPMWEQFANKSIFTGHKLISRDLEEVAPAFQYKNYTSETAIQLGKLTGKIFGYDNAASPIMVDNYIKQWSGPLGQAAIGIVDQGLRAAGIGKSKHDPEKSLADNVFFQSFIVRYPSASSASIDGFYEKAAKIESHYETFRMLAKKSGPAAEATAAEYADEVEGKVGAIRRITKALSESRKYINAITDNPKIEPYEKRQLIDGHTFQMIGAAKMGLEIMDNMQKGLEERQNLIKQQQKAATIGP